MIQGLGTDFADVLVDGTIKNIKCTLLWGPIDMLVDSDSRKSSVGTRNAFPHAGQGSADFAWYESVDLQHSEISHRCSVFWKMKRAMFVCVCIEVAH